MKAVSIILAGVAASLASGYTIRSASDLPAEDVASAEGGITFTGPAFVGGPDVILNGTAESIYKQLLALNPEYDETNFEDDLPEDDVEEAGGLSARADNYQCKPAGRMTYGPHCQTGISYLRRLNGYCGAPAGHGGCSRVSCAWNCGIFLCNDNSYKINIPCKKLAGDAEGILKTCTTPFDNGDVKGQVFRNGHKPVYNVIIKHQDC